MPKFRYRSCIMAVAWAPVFWLLPRGQNLGLGSASRSNVWPRPWFCHHTAKPSRGQSFSHETEARRLSLRHLPRPMFPSQAKILACAEAQAKFLVLRPGETKTLVSKPDEAKILASKPRPEGRGRGQCYKAEYKRLASRPRLRPKF